MGILKHENTNIVIENHYLGAIINKGQFDTFYHEHPRTYSFRSFDFIAKSLKMNVFDVEFVSRYWGNIRVYLGNGEKNYFDIEENHFASSFEKLWKPHQKQSFCAESGLEVSTPRLTNKIFSVFGKEAWTR